MAVSTTSFAIETYWVMQSKVIVRYIVQGQVSRSSFQIPRLHIDFARPLQVDFLAADSVMFRLPGAKVTLLDGLMVPFGIPSCFRVNHLNRHDGFARDFRDGRLTFSDGSSEVSA